MKAAVCAAVVLCVLIIVIAPQVDLPPTVLRSAQFVTISLLIQLAAFALVFILSFRFNNPTSNLVWFTETLSPPRVSPLAIQCVRRC